MVHLGYHASHEQFKPSQLLEWVQRAEQAGFTHALSSDHFLPWSEDQGQSGFAWSWLGAAMQATNLHFRIVNAPGQRYHPAIIAQAAGTLMEMFPHRFWLTVGSGQAVNEHITGAHWPSKGDRNCRLKECIDIMRALWAGETVNHHGLVTVEDAQLYTRPDYQPKIIGAAITPKTAEWLGGWADGLITTSRPPEQLKPLVEAFRRGGGEGKPMILKVQLSYDRTQEAALAGAHQQWRNNVFESVMLSDTRTVEQFDVAGAFVTPADMEGQVRISADPQQHLDWLKTDIELGFDELILHNVNTAQAQFIDTFGETVIPALTKK
ncbi:TIGR03885 family FMN-dependent LLM class oxidoreductase [Leptolyngbya sp. KIOST-1]|uniref:TIGR03885 family FMN-dependent LLM class oxidoreductase n=1 Tax=Leptolyngbya sp. KIOST-1 TaxID=1229172 RepID=UPI0005649520|nr:TIGR03885 family FMN-dependent LLM class oxidoreductase [Leptolyngbya sp. KIOST-1]